MIYVPQYEELTLEKILEYALAHASVVNALPPEREIWKLPRAYVCNVIFTILGEPFQAWVNERCQKRNEKLAIEKDLNIQLDANVAKAFHASTTISCMSILFAFFFRFFHFIIDPIFVVLEARGTGGLLMKVGSKRRRTKQEILDQKEESMMKQQAIEEKLAKFDQMKRELEQAKQMAEVNAEASEIVQGMLDQGFVEKAEDGTIMPSQSFMEAQNHWGFDQIKIELEQAKQMA